MRAPLVSLSLFFAALTSCEGFVDPLVGAGIGASCTRDDECQGATCQEGICANACEFGRCPSGLVCSRDLCQLPLRVGFVYAGALNQEELSQSFEEGRQSTQAKVTYVDSAFVDDQPLGAGAVAAAQTFISEGKQVIVATNTMFGAPMKQLADANGSLQFIVHASQVTSGNLSSFDARTYQGYYLAGVAAAQKAGPTTSAVRLGFLASIVSPPVVASVNAFTLGARSVNPMASVEVSFLGDFHDRTNNQRDRSLALDLVTRGAVVVAHSLDNNIPVAAIAEMPAVWSVGANTKTGCAGAMTAGNCIGSVYFNWSPLFADMFDLVHRQERLPGRVLRGIRPNPDDSVVDFVVSDNIGGASVLKQQIDVERAALAADNGVGRVFAGPIVSTGQCPDETMDAPCVAEGATLSEDRLASMCFFVQGVIQDDGTPTGIPAQVPAEQDCIPRM